MDRASLESFILVAENRSFSRAAEQQHITQPAISKRIHNLETLLGAQLLMRQHKTVQLTHSGTIFLQHAHRLIEAMNDCQTAIRNTRQKIAGNLKLGVSHHIGLHRMPAFLKMFATIFPDVQLKIRFIDSEEAPSLIQSGALELAIATLPDTPPTHIYQQTIWDDPLHFVVSGDHPLAQLNARQRLSLADLCPHAAILPGNNTHTGQLVQQLFRDQQLSLEHFIETNNLETIRMMVSIGLGWAVLPRTMLNNQLQGLILDQQTKIPARRLGLLHHHSRVLSTAAEAFIQTLQSQNKAGQ